MHRPSNKFFPQKLQERAAWFDNYNAKIQLHGASLGFSAAERGQVATDNTLIQFLANSAHTIEAYSNAVVAFRQTVTEGEVGEPSRSFRRTWN